MAEPLRGRTATSILFLSAPEHSRSTLMTSRKLARPCFCPSRRQSTRSPRDAVRRCPWCAGAKSRYRQGSLRDSSQFHTSEFVSAVRHPGSGAYQTLTETKAGIRALQRRQVMNAEPLRSFSSAPVIRCHQAGVRLPRSGTGADDRSIGHRHGVPAGTERSSLNRLPHAKRTAHPHRDYCPVQMSVPPLN
jgi:hypothetical protein